MISQFDQHILVKNLLFALVALGPSTDNFRVALEKVEEGALVQFVVLDLHDRATNEMTNPVTGMESSLCHRFVLVLTVDDLVMV